MMNIAMLPFTPLLCRGHSKKACSGSFELSKTPSQIKLIVAIDNDNFIRATIPILHFIALGKIAEDILKKKAYKYEFKHFPYFNWGYISDEVKNSEFMLAYKHRIKTCADRLNKKRRDLSEILSNAPTPANTQFRSELEQMYEQYSKLQEQKQL